ncbi:cleavage and polyadenylation specificity factor subunit 3 [Nannochloropsis gaditana]|uniref:Cleavage and polyadenylation specificity factor subunit 3 n=1 Tax=Nannochloropsis gaditana TaxID=72520 RepID=W7TRH2_9STRA|nr:cleavage and polyadenylation specificity factor subunit 3 [Nannochloropsis gaditana]
MAYKRSHYHPTRLSSNEEDEDTVYFTPLGAAKEVGRSCLILRYKGRTIMLDCGIHPGRTGDDALPFFDSGPDAEEIDIILISHFHLDHAASLPYFTEKVQGGAFKGRIFATHPTKAIMRLMLQNHIRTDSVRLAADGTSADEGAEAPLYTEEELQAGAPQDHGCSSIRISNNKELAVCCVKEHLKSPQPSSWAWARGASGRQVLVL